MYTIDRLDQFVLLGNRGDFGHTVQFDLSSWSSLGADDWKITCTRPGETAAFPVAASDIAVVNDILTWTVSAAVTDNEGYGTAVIEAYRGLTFLKHSPITQTIVGPGHPAAGAAPTPVADWIADATAKLDEVDPAIAAMAAAEIDSVSFVANDMVFVKGNTDTVTLAGAKTALKGDQGIQGIQGPTGDPAVHVGTTAPTDPNKTVWIDTDEAYDVDLDAILALIPLTGSGAPSANAGYVGQIYIDTAGFAGYMAVKTGTGAGDWKQVTA